ncbi:Uncharacterised protein [Neisseria gonorrhoeae]|nr:Uncharacterised protein [Neisseria gonorrhoeae]
MGTPVCLKLYHIPDLSNLLQTFRSNLLIKLHSIFGTRLFVLLFIQAVIQDFPGAIGYADAVEFRLMSCNCIFKSLKRLIVKIFVNETRLDILSKILIFIPFKNTGQTFFRSSRNGQHFDFQSRFSRGFNAHAYCFSITESSFFQNVPGVFQCRFSYSYSQLACIFLCLLRRINDSRRNWYFLPHNVGINMYMPSL